MELRYAETSLTIFKKLVVVKKVIEIGNRYNTFIMLPPLIGGGIKRWCCLTYFCRLSLSVCLTSVADIMNIHGAYSYWKLGAAGVRRVWAGSGPQRVAYRGGAYRAAPCTAC